MVMAHSGSENLLPNNMPLIVAGMHRSGTSLMTAVVGALGVDLGDRLLDGDIHNAKGYFEDVDFLEFQRRILQERSPANDLGWPDWGWTESEQLNLQNLDAYLPDAKALIASRSSQGLWGWKDPRTTLLLDFWADLLPNARYLLVYRFPWDVADSVLRVNHPTFVANPDYALRSWYIYNRSLLRFYEKHQDQSLLINVNAFLENPETGLKLLQTKLNLAIQADQAEPEVLSQIFDPKLFASLGWDYPLARSLYTIAPRYFSLLKALDQAADLSSSMPDWVTVAPSIDDNPPIYDGVPPERAVLALHGCLIQNNFRHQQEMHQLSQQFAEKLDQTQAQFKMVEQSKGWRIQQALKRLKAKFV